MTENEPKIIINTIMRLLAAREHSCFELNQKLLAKGFSQQLCTDKISEFTANNLQSDQRFAESFVRGRAAKGIGEVRIRRDLHAHHISDEQIKQAFAEQNIDWFELALQVKNKKYGEAHAENWNELHKRAKFLQYRGFTLEQIQEVNQMQKECF